MSMRCLLLWDLCSLQPWLTLWPFQAVSKLQSNAPPSLHPPACSAGFRILVPTQPPPLPPIDMWVFLYAFKWSVWIAILLICIFVALAAWGVEAALGTRRAGSRDAAAPAAGNGCQLPTPGAHSASQADCTAASGCRPRRPGGGAGSASDDAEDRKEDSCTGSEATRQGVPPASQRTKVQSRRRAVWHKINGDRIEETCKDLSRNLFASLSHPVGGRGVSWARLVAAG